MDLNQFLYDTQFLDYMPPGAPRRIADCFKRAGIADFAELMQKSEADLLALPGFGRRSLAALKYALANIGLHLGMPVQ
jgi:DNA-directed RNA polymerase alpha subunit